VITSLLASNTTKDGKILNEESIKAVAAFTYLGESTLIVHDVLSLTPPIAGADTVCSTDMGPSRGSLKIDHDS
jgi:hypothetical protein